MRKICSFLLVFTLLLTNKINAQLSSVMTFNVRLDIGIDQDNNWDLRRAEFIDLIKFYQPGILGVQEAMPQQMDYIDSCLSTYSYIGVGRDDGKRLGEFSAVFYDTSLYCVHEHSTFWLSETPNEASMGWDAAFKRVCTYGLFENLKTQQQFWVLNTHFDHKGEKAQLASADLILDMINKLTGKQDFPLILMGDFNCLPEHPAIVKISKLLNDSYEHSTTKHYGPTGTFNDFKPNEITTERIDYIFTKNLKPIKHRHIDDRRQNNLCVSDHFPVMVEFE